MVLRKITKKRYRNHIGGAAPPKDNKKDGGDSANNAKIAATVTDKNIKDFKNEDYSRGWIVHDLYLAAPVKTEKDYIKQAIVVKRKKVEKKKKEEKFSTVKGIETLKKSTGGLFSAIKKGMTEGRQNFDRFMQGAESIKRGLSGQGKYGSQFSAQMGKINAQGKKIKSQYKKAKTKIKKNKDNAIKKKKNKITESIKKDENLKDMGITNVDGLTNKVKSAMDDNIKPGLMTIDSVLKHMGTSKFFKKDNFESKLSKMNKAMKNYLDTKSILMANSDDNTLFKLYEERVKGGGQEPNRTDKKVIKDAVEKSGLGDVIDNYIVLTSKIYQGFLFLVITYLSLQMPHEEDLKKKESNKISQDDSKKEILKLIENRFSDDYNPTDSSWKKFKDEELSSEEKPFSLRYFANKYPEKYYRSLRTIADPGYIDSAKDKKEGFGGKKISVLYITLRFIKYNPIFDELKLKDGFQHFKKAGCKDVPLMIDDYIKELKNINKYQDTFNTISEINSLIQTEDNYNSECEKDTEEITKKFNKIDISTLDKINQEDIKTVNQFIKRKENLNNDEKEKLKSVLQKCTDNDVEKATKVDTYFTNLNIVKDEFIKNIKTLVDKPQNNAK